MIGKRAEAARILLKLRDAEESFLGFVRLMHPEWTLEPFQLELIDVLDRLAKRTLTHPDTGRPVTRVLINMPPRHSKSALATWLFPAWYLAKFSGHHVLSTCYSDDLASTFGSKVRQYTEDPRILQVFPNFRIRQDTRAKDDWATTQGGSYNGVGIGGSTTGKAAHCLIIDDPVKNRSEAESATFRNRTWEFYTGSLENRKEPSPDGLPPIELVILTRWHPDDLGGRIELTPHYADKLWLHIKKPAINDNGEALWPCRFPVDELLLKQQLNPRDFASLYQQTPTLKGGNLLKAHWWQYRDKEPTKDDLAAVIIACDTAFKANTQSDYSVALTVAIDHQGDIHILDILRERLEYPDLKRKLIALNARFRGSALKGLYIEDKASGQSLIQDLKKESGIAVIPVKVIADKVSRITAQTPLIEGGRVYLPKSATWLDAFLQECLEFPGGTHDDQIDALSIALDAISRINIHAAEILAAPLKMTGSLNQQIANNNQPICTLFPGWGEW